MVTPRIYEVFQGNAESRNEKVLDDEWAMIWSRQSVGEQDRRKQHFSYFAPIFGAIFYFAPIFGAETRH